MVRKSIVIGLLFVLVWGQSIGQKPQFRNIHPIDALNTEGEEIQPLISADGESLYFSRAFYGGNVGGDYAGCDIWISKKTDEGWGTAERAPNSVNNKDNNAIIGINSNGNVLYLLNSYKRSDGISYTDGNWSKPALIDLEGISSDGFIGVYVSPDFSVILLSMEKQGSKGKEDLYVSLRDSTSGSWSRPAPLGPTINTSGFEISPFLSADKRFLFFSSNGHGGLGDADIFMAERLYDRWDVWSAPVNLGSGINSEKFDAYFSISSDSTVYFSSNRQNELSDIYAAELFVDRKVRRQGDAQKIIAEAELLLNELRESNVKDEVLLKFEPGSDLLDEQAKADLRGLIDRLKYQDYTSFHLLTVDPSGQLDEELRLARIEAVKQFISILGVGGKNIFDYPAAQRVTMKGGEVFNNAEGILIIVKD